MIRVMARVRRRTSYGKEIYYILCLLFIVGFALFTIFGGGGFREFKKARLELEMHRNRSDAIKKENNERLRTIEQLKSDRSALERYARGKGYGKTGEIVQQVPDPPPEKK